jgi:type I restriction enzyme M protein
LFHEFVKHGKKPEETKNQFCIPSEWVKTLDPRIKEKIRTETRADMEAKGKIEKAKKAEELVKKNKSKKDYRCRQANGTEGIRPNA